MAKGKVFGYIRVSSVDQNEARQVAALEAEGVDKLFVDKYSGKSLDRPELTKLLDYVRDGDTIIVTSIDRLARSLLDLERLVSDLNAREVTLRFLKENLVFDGSENPMAKFQRQIMGAFAEFERSIIRERQKEGILIAKQKGVYKGRQPAITKAQAVELRQRAAAGERHVDIYRGMGISRPTFYRYLKPEATA